MDIALVVFYVLWFALIIFGLKIYIENIRLNKKIDEFRKILDADRDKFLNAIEQLVEKQK